MTKLRLSLKHKILLAILLPVSVVLIALWLLQVVFLEDYYLKAKRDDMVKLTMEVAGYVKEKGQQESLDDIYKIALENTLCIDVTSLKDSSAVIYEGLGDNCYLHMSSVNKSAVIMDILKSTDDYVISDIKHPRYDTRYYICGTKQQANNGQTYIVMVVATLAPVKEAVSVIKNQLLYLTIALVVVTVIIALFIARSLTKPILKISNAARKVAQGQLDVKVEINSNDEVGELGQNFNYMTNEIMKVNTLQRELVANISHDIRTPLTMIKGYAEAIKDITGDDKQKREMQLDVIVEESDRLNSLVNDVMDLSLMQAGQTKFNFTTVDIREIAFQIIKKFELMAAQNDINLVFEAPDEVLVVADQIKIEQVLYNLISNAINHIGTGNLITVRITPAKDTAKVEVIDTGVGISPQDLPLIWDRYYKPYKKTQRKAVGTGLGLSIVKAILIKHTANFGVISKLEQGSNFWFELTLSSGEQE
ncbi:MAG: HAMP domain-containing sensor histidine kinase [Oscillospiraceae bacterium]